MVREYKYKIGSRAQVMHGTAKITGGGLTKKQLKYNKQGKIVSRKASKAAKKSKNLIKAGYITRKGQFGVVKRGGATNQKIASIQKELGKLIKEKEKLIAKSISSGNKSSITWKTKNINKKYTKLHNKINKLHLHRRFTNQFSNGWSNNNKY